MNGGFKDYYAPFKRDVEGINPSLGREDNLKRFSDASARYAQMYGKDVELALIREALGVFGNETKYQEYRKAYVDHSLIGFLKGAVENNCMTKNKLADLLVEAKKQGVHETEVKAYLNFLTIKIIAGGTGTGHGPKLRRIWIVLGIIVVLGLAGILTYEIVSKSNRREELPPVEQTIDFDQATRFIDIKPPEYSKVEDAVKAFKANIQKPGAKEGLIKAADIYIKWGDDSPTYEESRSMYMKALECSSAAQSSKTDEIKSKLEELSN